MKKLLFFPALETQSEFNDLTSRIGWYFHPYRTKIASLRVLLKPGFSASLFEVPSGHDPLIEKRVANLDEQLEIVSDASESPDALLAEIDEADAVLV